MWWVDFLLLVVCMLVTSTHREQQKTTFLHDVLNISSGFERFWITFDYSCFVSMCVYVWVFFSMILRKAHFLVFFNDVVENSVFSLLRSNWFHWWIIWKKKQKGKTNEFNNFANIKSISLANETKCLAFWTVIHFSFE